MKHPDADDNARNPGAEIGRPSAIERQLASASRNYGYETPYEAADPEVRQRYYYAKHRRRSRVGLVIMLALLLAVGVGAAFVFTQLGWPPRSDFGGFNLGGQKVEGQKATQTAVIANSPTNAAPAIALKQVADTAIPDALSVPIADVSLWDRPELLEQLVNVYRSQLAANPSDSVALAALDRLREQSLSQLETIMMGTPDATSFKSLRLVARLFPELIDNPRFSTLIAQSGKIQRESQPKTSTETSTEPMAAPQPATPSTAAISSAPVSPRPAPKESISEASVSQMRLSQEKRISPSAVAATEIAKKPAVTAASTKPQIRVLSITPGTMIEQRFMPSNQGKVFMVEISYRNLLNAEEQSEPSLVALLGTPGDSEALAEVPVDISGDRGTKSFLMETFTLGSAGEKYRLNFLLNGEFLASSTVRLSAPER